MPLQKQYIVLNSNGTVHCISASFSVAYDIVKIEEKQGNTDLTIKEVPCWNSTSLYLIDKYKVVPTS